MQRELTIGRLATLAGVNVETIRYYQRRGLLDEPRKPHRGHRHYPADMAKRVGFIKRAQALGFTLEEIASLLRLEGADCCADTRELAAHKVTLIERRLLDLAAMRDALTALVHQCDTGRTEGPCPIISVLAQND
ncbi:MerR family DNA-binding protein (plasmid) [Methylocapsa polymorpha]|uniref:Mercuric resistance operon regulatory protein n=1 Tax=Methylocapsa polymorpha TaxID=3080828 RepID=A0ABZ0HYB8_9HYPH|nr:MerR family transcriptional regulator [Methylocapsa sp. RX1]WOJ91728.1 MerR family DNA-binding protein [Methylocapsa sp. RX1]